MDESRKKFAELLENADKIPLDQLRKEAFDSFREILYKKPTEWYTETGGHRDISLYTAAVQLQYFLALDAAAALCIYITRSEGTSPKTKPKRKQELLSIEAKKAIAKEVKKAITKYKRKKQVITS